MLLINMIHQFSFQNYKKLSFVRNSLMSKVRAQYIQKQVI